MSARRRYSTCTVADDGRLVPWLATSGPLSYTPEDPPPSDYHFQYGWILPGIFCPSERQRRHFYFGASVKDHAAELFSFWRAATPISNVRFTTFFCGEQEVRIIDPDLVEFLESEGCRVERHGPSR